MKLYRTVLGVALQRGDETLSLPGVEWDALLRREDLAAWLARAEGEPLEAGFLEREENLLAPIGSQEVWASGVTYHSSRLARMEESAAAGGGDFYARVYRAPRPELFFKSLPQRVSGPGQPVRIRRDSEWDVPEPELTLALAPSGALAGYTVGNDMSSRSIEGENPLYLPQAKTYERAAALGPCLLVPDEPPPPETAIRLRVWRGEEAAFEGETRIGEMTRSFEELAGYLFRELAFPNGAYLMTGTGVVPGRDFALLPGDRVEIAIDGIGTLSNPVERAG